MASGAYFLGECPTCSRKLEIRVELLGKRVACQHCGAVHIASSVPERTASDQKIEQLLARAKAYVASVETPYFTAGE